MRYYLMRAAGVMAMVAFVIFLAVVQGAAVFPDPDAFYHIGMAQQLGQFDWTKYFVGQFSGLAPTTLGEHFVDQHFLLHALLYPWVHWLGPVVGTKAFIIMLLLGCVATFAWMLRVLKLRGWWVAVGLLCLTNPWLFRLNLVKATPLALILLFLAVVALAKSKPRWLVLIGGVYVWTHGGFILLPVVVAVWCLSRRMVWPLVYCVLGIGLALLAHPAWPHNLYFYWEQLVQIGAINYQASIGVGGEWYPYEPGSLLFGHGLLFVMLLGSVVWQVVRRQQFTATQAFFVITTIGMALLTFKSRRYVEYFSPLVAATAASFLVGAMPALSPGRRYLINVLPACILIMAIIPVALTGLAGLYRDMHNGQATDYLHGVGRYLAAVEPGLVAPSDWDDFPSLWQQAPQQQYLIGLDPTFLYRADANRYTAWKHITLGEAAEPVTATTIIAADYYVVTSDHQAMYRQLLTAGATVVYQDAEAWVLQLP